MWHLPGSRAGVRASPILNEAVATNPVGALFVSLHLLKGDADAKRKLCLRKTAGLADGTPVLRDPLYCVARSPMCFLHQAGRRAAYRI